MSRSIPSRERVAHSVLIVDDYQPTVEAIARLLTLLGHKVVACTDPTKCLRMAETDKPDAILLDLTMPDVSGFELIGPLRLQVGNQCRILALSGHADEHMRKRCAAAGFDGFLAKPASAEELETALQANEL